MDISVQELEGVPVELFKRLPEDAWVEVVDGRLVVQTMTGSYRHVVVIDNLYDALSPFVRQHRLGRVFTDGLHYILHQAGDTIRRSRIPDLSYVRREHLPPDLDPDAGFPGAPDLAVEVVSPNQPARELLERIADYRAAGTEQIWVIYPAEQQLHIYLRDDLQHVRVYSAGEQLEAPTLFPGWQVLVDDLVKVEA